MQELSGISEAARELAMSRFRLIQPHLEENLPLQLVAADARLSFRTAQRWVSQYRKFGLIALVRKSRDDRGGRRVVSPKIKAAIEALALESPPLPVRSICRQVRQFAQATGEPLPRYGTVYDLVRDVPMGLLTLAHRGGMNFVPWMPTRCRSYSSGAGRLKALRFPMRNSSRRSLPALYG